MSVSRSSLVSNRDTVSQPLMILKTSETCKLSNNFIPQGVDVIARCFLARAVCLTTRLPFWARRLSCELCIESRTKDWATEFCLGFH